MLEPAHIHNVSAREKVPPPVIFLCIVHPFSEYTSVFPPYSSVPLELVSVSPGHIVSVPRACNARSTGVQRPLHEAATRVARSCNAGDVRHKNGNERP